MKNEELKNVLNDKNLERVVGGVDDGSTDNAGKIIDEYAKKDKRVKVNNDKTNSHDQDTLNW